MGSGDGQYNVPEPKPSDLKFSEALDTITKNPRVGSVPPIKYDINVAQQLASVLSIDSDPW